MTMNDDEFDLCNKKCQKLMKDRIGKQVKRDFQWILEAIFREGYKFAKEKKT